MLMGIIAIIVICAVFGIVFVEYTHQKQDREAIGQHAKVFFATEFLIFNLLNRKAAIKGR